MPQDIPLACACGAFQAVVRDVSPRTGNHVFCYCADCQAAARYLGHADRILDEKGGTDLYHTQPNQFDITKGRELLSVLRLGPKGLNRWYVTCCNTPIGSTPGTPKFALVGLPLANMVPPLDALGPVMLRYKPEQALAPVTESKGSAPAFILRTLRNAARALMTGTWRDTPFFDVATGRPPVKPHVLSAEERAKAYKT